MRENFVKRIERLKKRQNEMMKIYLMIIAMLMLSYFLGTAGFSLFWMVILSFLTLIMWRRRVIALNEEELKDKEESLLKMKMGDCHESGQWLNKLINFWLKFSSASMTQVYKQRIDIFLDAVKPYFLNSLSLSQLDLHQGSIIFRDITSFDNIAALYCDEDQQLPIVSQYNQNVVFEARVKAVFPQPVTIKAALSPSLSTDLILHHVSLDGRVRFEMFVNKLIPFPHIHSLTFSFMQKPHLDYSWKVLKNVELMEVPLLRLWIDSMISSVFLESSIAPYKIHLPLHYNAPFIPSPSSTQQSMAQGLAMIQVKISFDNDLPQKPLSASDLLSDRNYCNISIGKEKASSLSSTTLAPSSFSSSSFSFDYSVPLLVCDLQKDTLKIEVMQRVLGLGDKRLSYVHVPIHSLNLPSNLVGELKKEEDGVVMEATVTWCSLANIKKFIDQPSPSKSVPSAQNNLTRGVLSVCLHGASDVDTKNNMFCVLYCNNQQVYCTHHINNDSTASWNSTKQIIVSNINKTKLTVVLLEWHGGQVKNDDVVGYATIDKTETPISHQCFSLIDDKGDHAGNVIVSVVFSPVSLLPDTSQSSISKSKKSSFTQKEMLELYVIQASNLLAKDTNGLSDPYFEVKVGGVRKFKSEIIKKTLNPSWKALCQVAMPKDDNENIEIVLWDHDLVSSDDFLGKVSLNRRQLLAYASKQQFTGWLKLQEVSQGNVQVEMKVIGGSNDDTKYIEGNDGETMQECNGNIKGELQRGDNDDIIDTKLFDISQNSLGASSELNSFFNDSLIGSKIDEFNTEFCKGSPSLREAERRIYKNINLSVVSVQSLPSFKMARCHVKINSVVENKVKTLAQSQPFAHSSLIPLNLSFQVDGSKGESERSKVSFKFKKSYNTIAKMTSELAQLLPERGNETKRCTLSNGEIKLHVICTCGHMP